ncbi:MAG: DJ-1/PfpI family protein, partial [Gammaproteobacteria bacterium]|nr:DJ-1/PfpI family protein [Gammaproteobacteria bacterium]
MSDLNTDQHAGDMLPTAAPSTPITNKASGELRNFAFLLLENFSMMALTAAIDALRTANLLAESELFSYQLVSVDGASICGDLGFSAVVDAQLAELNWQQVDALVVCGGLRVDLHADAALTRFLHRPELKSLALGSLWNGVFALAHAGLLDGVPCAVHRENRASLRELFSRVDVKDRAYIIHNNFFTCAGGNSSLDMMLELIAASQGKQFVRGICDILTCDRINDAGEPAFLHDSPEMPLPQNLKDVIGLMENNMEEMLTPEEIAALVGITRRQVERLFQRYLGSTPTRYYLELRLKRAHQLLQQTQL